MPVAAGPARCAHSGWVLLTGWLYAKKPLNFGNHSHEPIDFVGRIVKVKARARRGLDSKFSHERLVAMVPAAQGDSPLIGESHDIVRVHAFHDKAHQSGAADMRTEEPNPLEAG